MNSFIKEVIKMGKKICMVVPGLDYCGGTERVTIQIANKLLERGYEISILSLEKGLNPTFFVDERIKLYELNIGWVTLKSMGEQSTVKKLWSMAKRFFTEIKITKKLYSKLKELDPDIVIVSEIAHYSKVEVARKFLKFKTIAWEMFCLDMRQSLVVNYSRRLAVKYAHKIVVQGDNDRQSYLSKYSGRENIECIYNSSSFDISNNASMDSKVIISAGRYTFEKGFDMLIEVWNKIYEKIPDWELRIFGDGDQRESLQALIDKYNIPNIELCGFTNNLAQEMDKASIYALTSRFEGFGMVLVEAQSRGLPIVSFDIKQGPNLIIDNGVNGFLVDAYDTDMFAQKLLQLTQDTELWNSFSKNSQKDLWRFDIEVITDKWQSIVESALNS